MAHAARPLHTFAPLSSETAAGEPEEASRADAEQDRQLRLDDHGAVFYRLILEGAFERVYRPDGSYRLREIGSGLFLEDLDAAGRPKGKPAAK